MGEYRLIREIGRGGMGVVFEAVQESLGRTVAIKLLPFAAVLDSRQITRFKNEAHAAAQLNHPNIVPVYSVGFERGVHYYAMQLIVGEALDEFISRHIDMKQKTDTRRVVEAGIQAAEALHSAHRDGVVHREIKPSNLMLDRDGKLWVTDFGLARCQTDVTMTMTGNVVGTVRYMIPEQASGNSALVDGRADIYSLGATLYELLCLNPVYPGDDAKTILRQMDAHNIRPLRSLRPDVPVDLATVIAKAMSQNRDGRYETAREFAEDLRRAMDGRPTNARPPTVIDLLAGWAYRHTHFVLTSAAIGLLALIGFAVSTAMIASEKYKADISAAQAELSARDARDAVDRMGAQMAEELAEIPSAAGVRKKLLLETLAYYEKFVRRAAVNPSLGEDPTLLRDLAMTYGKIGSLQSDVGTQPAALEALSNSKQLFRQLLLREPEQIETQRLLATSCNNLALAQQDDGNFSESSDNYRQAIELQKKLCSSSASASMSEHLLQSHLDLAMSHNNYGLLLAKSQLSDKAAGEYYESIRLLKSIDLPSVSFKNY